MGIKVSIVIPVFNGAENLQSCLAKLQEVITREVQIVIVDDGSTDASFIVASEFARNFENVTLHRIVGNKGAGNARNVGLDLSVGTYIYFLDCDDAVCGDFLSGLESVSRNKADLILAPIQKPSSEIINESFLNFLGQLVKTEREDLLAAIVQFEAWPIQCWGLFIRREFLISNQIRFEPIRIGEDLVFMTSVFLKFQAFATVSEPVYVHTRRPGSLGKSFSTQDIDSWFLGFVSLARLAEHYSITSPEGDLLANRLTLSFSYFLIAFILSGSTSKKEFLQRMVDNRDIFFLSKLAYIDLTKNLDPDAIMAVLLNASLLSIKKSVGDIGQGQNYLYCYDRLSLGTYLSLKSLNFKIDGIIDDNLDLLTPNQELDILTVSPETLKGQFLYDSTIIVCHDLQKVFLAKEKYFKEYIDCGLRFIKLTSEDFAGEIPIQSFFS